MNPTKPKTSSPSLSKQEMIKQINQKIAELNRLYIHFRQEKQKFQDPSSDEMMAHIRSKLAQLSGLREKLLNVADSNNVTNKNTPKVEDSNFKEGGEVGKIEKIGPDGVTIASTDPSNKIKTVVPQTSLIKDPTTGKYVLNKVSGTTAAPGTAPQQAAQDKPRPGQQVNMVADSMKEDPSPVGSVNSPQDDNKLDASSAGVNSPISGDEDHDEISKMLVMKLRQLAGL